VYRSLPFGTARHVLYAYGLSRICDSFFVCCTSEGIADIFWQFLFLHLHLLVGVAHSESFRMGGLLLDVDIIHSIPLCIFILHCSIGHVRVITKSPISFGIEDPFGIFDTCWIRLVTLGYARLSQSTSKPPLRIISSPPTDFFTCPSRMSYQHDSLRCSSLPPIEHRAP
jgi:hypothetical protein